MAGTNTAESRLENSAKVSFCWLKFTHVFYLKLYAGTFGDTVDKQKAKQARKNDLSIALFTNFYKLANIFFI
jgi:hypothetical protein